MTCQCPSGLRCPGHIVRRIYRRTHIRHLDANIRYYSFPHKRLYTTLRLGHHPIEPEPFMVPPVLTKSAIVEQPILRVIWHRAYQALQTATEVTFVGYSLPITDVSVTILLFEALQGLLPDRIKVVNIASIKSEKSSVQERYRKVLGTIPDKNFEFGGALDWARSLATLV